MNGPTEKREWLPPHTRLILVSEDLLSQIGTRTEDGYAITAEWGKQQPKGWYEPTFTVHYDRPLPEMAERLEVIRIRLRALRLAVTHSGLFIHAAAAEALTDRIDALLAEVTP